MLREGDELRLGLLEACGLLVAPLAEELREGERDTLGDRDREGEAECVGDTDGDLEVAALAVLEGEKESTDTLGEAVGEPLALAHREGLAEPLGECEALAEGVLETDSEGEVVGDTRLEGVRVDVPLPQRDGVDVPVGQSEVERVRVTETVAEVLLVCGCTWHRRHRAQAKRSRCIDKEGQRSGEEPQQRGCREYYGWHVSAGTRRL